MNEENIAYISYKGHLVESGYLDARKSAEALTGIDEIIRYFLFQEDPSLQELHIEVPIKIQKGSWEALIPHNIEEWIKTAVGLGITTYSTTALKKLAENDFKDKKIKDIFIGAFKGIRWVLKIASHLGSMAIKKIENAKFEGDNTWVTITNEVGESILVPYKYLEIYVSCPDKIFARVTNVIEDGRILAIGLNSSDNEDDGKEIQINATQKWIFTSKDTNNDILFPDLVHDMYIEIEGHVTRGNENSNTIGFEYNKHILTCMPAQGNIINYKPLLFTNCIIKGYVDRLGVDGEINEKRPRIRFLDLVEIPPKTKADLFRQ
ncbi:MAG: hypothetical protein WC150_12905 [Bacteroidia bacterium]